MPEPKKPSRPSSASLRRAFREIIWPRRKLVLVGLVLILLNRVSGLVLPASTKYLIDDVISGGQAELFWTLILAVAVAVTIQAVTSFGLTRLLSVEAQHLIAQLRSEVQYHVLRLPVKSFDESKTGELVSRVMDDIEGVRKRIGQSISVVNSAVPRVWRSGWLIGGLAGQRLPEDRAGMRVGKA